MAADDGARAAELADVRATDVPARLRALTPAQRRTVDEEFARFAATAQRDLARTAWLLTGDVHDAAELVQQALVRTYTAWPRAREGEPLAYARRVMANARIDGWRRRRRETLVAPADLPERGDRDRAPRDGHADADTRDSLVRALATLSARQRRVVVLRHLVGLSEQEVADDLGISTGSVKTHASRGLRRLREAMDDAAGEPATTRTTEGRTDA